LICATALAVEDAAGDDAAGDDAAGAELLLLLPPQAARPAPRAHARKMLDTAR
jgi:hypothetical protein